MSNASDFDPRQEPRLARLQSEFADALELQVFKFLQDGLDIDSAIHEVAQRSGALIENLFGPIPEGEHFIPPVIECSMEEVARWFGADERRQELLKRIRRWFELAKAVGARRLLLDGSFVTSKSVPNDVDAAILLPEDFQARIDENDATAVELTEMFVSRQPAELFAAEEEADWWNWCEFFGRTRESTGRRKGLIELRLG